MLLSWLRTRIDRRGRKICFDVEARATVESTTLLIDASEVKIVVIQPGSGARPLCEMLKKVIAVLEGVAE